LKKPEDAKEWLLKMKRFFELHGYRESMKEIIYIFNLKGKADIWGEDVNWVRDIRITELSWHEVKILFTKKYFLERYYENKNKECYELKMVSMIDEEYTTKFLDILRWVLYLKDGKAKVQRIFSAFPSSFRDQIKYDEPESLE